MAADIGTVEQQPGFKRGIISCVCAGVGFFLPGLGLLMALIGYVSGVSGYKAAKRGGYKTGQTLGLVGSILGGISLLVSGIGFIALVTTLGQLGFIHPDYAILIVILAVMVAVIVTLWMFAPKRVALVATVFLLVGPPLGAVAYILYRFNEPGPVLGTDWTDDPTVLDQLNALQGD